MGRPKKRQDGPTVDDLLCLIAARLFRDNTTWEQYGEGLIRVRICTLGGVIVREFDPVMLPYIGRSGFLYDDSKVTDAGVKAAEELLNVMQDAKLIDLEKLQKSPHSGGGAKKASNFTGAKMRQPVDNSDRGGVGDYINGKGAQ